MAIDPQLLEILVCPACLVAVREIEGSGLECGECGRVYPVRDGIPVMLVQEASEPRAGGQDWPTAPKRGI